MKNENVRMQFLAGLITESQFRRINSILNESDENLEEAKLSPERQERLDGLIEDLEVATDPTGYDYDGPSPSNILKAVREEFGDTIADQLRDQNFHFPRLGFQPDDKLADRMKWGSTSYRTTKDGKMHKSDVEKAKNHYKRGY
jgi:hypothetical protein